MATEVKMPQISEDAESGTIVEVMVSEGDTIEAEQAIIAVESDKASVEVPSEAGGKIKSIKVSEGDEINIGDIILILEDSDGGDEDSEGDDDEKESEAEGKGKKDQSEVEDSESKEEDDDESDEQDEEEDEDVENEDDQEEEDDDEPEEEKTDPKEDSEKKPKKKEGEVPAAPSVRRMAREMNVDIYAVKGSGPGNRITAEDVKAAADDEGTQTKESKPKQKSSLPDFSQWGEIERKKMSGIRKATAKSMGNAWTTVPHVTQFDKANISTLEDFMKQYEDKAAKSGAKLTVTAVLVKLTASALRAFPKFNASLDMESQEIIYKKYINIGVAVDTENGLLVPVIKDADRKSVVSIALELSEIAEKARDGKLTSDEMKGGNFTVSNLGGIGGTNFTPIVYHPQVAILGVSRNQIEPVYQDGEFKPMTMLPLSLSYDHRAIDGAEAARFLRWMCQVMEDPFVMLMEGGI